MRWKAVIFDLGGVVLGSPLEAIARFEERQGLPAQFVNRQVAAGGSDGAWARLERGQLGLDDFFAAFEAECAAAGHRIDARALFAAMREAAAPRDPMLRALARIRASGLRAGALTNNWAGDGEPTAPLRGHFDVFVESSVEGLRKPDPRIYRLACARLGVEPAASVFLDDIGRNLKAARALGMHTIRVRDPDAALAELEGVIGVPLRQSA